MTKEKANIILQCILCEKKLAGVYGLTQPEGALCFTGTGHYGSRHDDAHQLINVDKFGIFVCDDCWVTKARKFAIGIKNPPPVRSERFFFSGEQVDRAFTESEETHHYVNISEMFIPKKGL